MKTMPAARPSLEDRRRLLERYLESSPKWRPSAPQGIPRRSPHEMVPLSFEQEQVWVHAQVAPEVPLYNEPLTILHTGPLDAAALERSFNEILRRHEAWRTSIRVVDGEPVQIVEPSLTVSLPVVDLRRLPREQREAEAARIAAEDARKPLDLGQVPLFRARLIQMDDEEHRLYLILSHIIFDGVAIYRVLLPELAGLYQAYTVGRPSPLPELPIQYADYACWQRRSIAAEQREKDLAYWRRQLADLPTLDLPADRPRRALSFRGAMHPFRLANDLTTALRELGRGAGTTLFQTLLAGFAVLLHRYSGQPDIPIGSVLGGRSHPDTLLLLGYFLNSVVLRLDLGGNPSFRELLARARHVTIEALGHGSVPFGDLVKELLIQRDPSRNPLFQVMFTLEPPLAKLDPAWDLTQAAVDTGATKYDLYFELDERREEILARFHYSTDLFDRSTIERMAGLWRTLLEGAVADPGRRVSELPLMTEPESIQLTAWNRTAHPYPQTTIPALFEVQAERSPRAVAVAFEGRTLSYRELNARANQLARHLRRRGVGPDCLVGLSVERSPEMVMALLAILKAGGAYVPLDPTHPRERLAVVLSDAEPPVIVTQRSVAERLPASAKRILLDADWNEIEREGTENSPDGAGPANLAYVMYTSGSTGVPKGVPIEHRAVVNFLCSMQREPGIAPKDVMLAVTTLGFDIAGLEVFLPLISGARVVLASSEAARDGSQLAGLLARSKATVMQATPATWRMLIESGWRGSIRLKLLCGGEAMAPELGRELRARGRSVWNLYGPTETTIWSAVYRLEGGEERFVPIGRPIANTEIYILDSHQNRVPVGVSGEICIGGDGLARGYLNRPELTAERFIPDHISQRPAARLYRTGDRGRFLPDGNIEFLGRWDNQVKIRGFRIELGSIESHLAEHPAVEAAVAAVQEEQPGDRFLVAYVRTAEGRMATAEELRDYLKQKLPEYMVPASFVFLDSFPLTPSGKIDRKSLPAPDRSLLGGDTTFVPARDRLEAQLVTLWEKMLGVTPIGVRDDFFALGGHSLLAVRMFALIESTFGKRIPPGTLFRASTIERLAEVLQEEKKPSHWLSFVPIQPSGSLSPLFCISSQFGDVLLYRPLSLRLGREVPFFALQILGQHGLPRRHTIEAMAADCLTEVRKIQPRGPYSLCGYCFGGRVALEMAQQLLAQGEDVAFLGLFVTYHHTATNFSDRIRLHLRQFRVMGMRPKLAYLTKNFAAKMRSRVWRLKHKLLRDVVPSSSPLFRNVAEMNLHALRCYVPKTYPGRMTVFMSGKVPPGFLLDPEARLKEYLHGIDAYEMDLRVVSGEADSMFQEPFVGVLTERLRTCLNDAAVHKSSATIPTKSPWRIAPDQVPAHPRGTTAARPVARNSSNGTDRGGGRGSTSSGSHT